MAVMDAKFSTFDNGGDLIPGDIVVGLRGGINTKFNNTGGVGTFLPLLGGTMLGVIDMGGFKITNLAAPTDPADAVTKTYVDSTFAHLGANSDITSMSGLTGYLASPLGLKDSSGNVMLGFNYAATPTDNLEITNGINNHSAISVNSTQTNASAALYAKGTGGWLIAGGTTSTVPLALGNTVNTFSFSIPTWTGNRTLTFPDANVTLVSGTMLTNALTSAHIFVGNVSNVATDVAMSGDATLINTGAITVASIGGKAVSLGGAFTMSGAFTFTGTLTGNTGVTFPTSGTLATTTGSLASITADSGSATVSGGAITLTGGSTGLTTSGSGSTVTLVGLLNSTFGGTGVSAPTAHGIMVAEGSSAMTPIVLSSGQILIGSTGVDPVAAAINSGAGILVGNGAGSITVQLAAIADHTLLANISGGALAPSSTTLTALIDNAIGSTQGDILYRNSTVWTVLAPSTAGYALITGGAAANPSWASVGAAYTASALTKTDDTNVTLTLGGTPSTALLQATSLTLGWTGQLGLTRGGTAASLTASNGGIVYSTASALAILAGTVTANQILMSGASTTPAWSTATYPATAGTSGNYLKSDGTNFVSTAPTAPTIQKFTSGSGTYTTAAGVLYIRVVMVGGGGGGAGSGSVTGTAATNGNASTFGTTLLSAGGGNLGAYGSAAGGTGGTSSLGSGPIGIALTGGSGGSCGTVQAGAGIRVSGGTGGSSAFGGAGYGSGSSTGTDGGAGVANTGGGGGGAGAYSTGFGGSGGGSGGYVDAIITSPSASYSYSVGTGGSAGGAGTSGQAGGAGGSGLIVVYEYYK